MDDLDERFEFKLSKEEKKALIRLAKHGDISMGHVIRNEIRRLAKRKKVWK